MMAPVDIHLVSWNRPKMTELVIRTIHRNTKPENFRLVVIDNGSDEKTMDMLTLLADNGKIDRLILNSENVGLELARQDLLINETYGEFLVCLDNDCLPPAMKDGQDWVERMLELMQKYEDFAAISMRTQVMIGTGNIFEEADKAGDDIVEFPHPGGSFRMMRTKAVSEVGGWDNPRPGRGAEERLIGKKLNNAGYRTAFATQIRCLHLFGMKDTDRWGYPKDWSPEATGHSDISHPALENGDDLEEVSLYAGEELAHDYSSN